MSLVKILKSKLTKSIGNIDIEGKADIKLDFRKKYYYENHSKIYIFFMFVIILILLFVVVKISDKEINIFRDNKFTNNAIARNEGIVVVNQTTINNNNIEIKREKTLFKITIEEKYGYKKISGINFYEDKECLDYPINPINPSDKEIYNLSLQMNKSSNKTIYIKYKDYDCLELNVSKDDISPVFVYSPKENKCWKRN